MNLTEKNVEITELLCIKICILLYNIFSTLLNSNSNFGFEFKYKFSWIRWGYQKKVLVHQVVNWPCSVLHALSTLVAAISSTLNFLSHTDESCKDKTRVCGYTTLQSQYLQWIWMFAVWAMLGVETL